MIVAAHQPSYMPWLGYLDKMARADVFVVMDDLQYEAQNFQNRNRVKVNNGAVWLTVPVRRDSQATRISEISIQGGGNPRQCWRRRSWMTLRHHYKDAPFFGAYAADIESIYARDWRWLVDLDLHVLELARRWLGITTPFRLSSSLRLQGARTERIANMCDKLGADAYLTGKGGSVGYLDVALLARRGVSVLWQDFRHPVYPQRYPELGFISHLAFIDLLFNCGPDGRDLLFPPYRARVDLEMRERGTCESNPG